jgi:hypothetical protein
MSARIYEVRFRFHSSIMISKKAYPELVARGLVRTFSDRLERSEYVTGESIPSRRLVESALREEVNREDQFSKLLDAASSR